MVFRVRLVIARHSLRHFAATSFGVSTAFNASRFRPGPAAFGGGEIDASAHARHRFGPAAGILLPHPSHGLRQPARRTVLSPSGQPGSRDARNINA